MSTNYEICGVSLDDIHNVQLQILDAVDEICKKNNIKYFLSGGTLLGAIRHKGFIPWDDDIDLWMTRENYNKFKKAIKTELPKEFCSMDYYEDIHYPLSIMKIEKVGTRYVEDIFSNINMTSGIYIDIFPLDNICLPFYNLQTAILIKMQSVRDFKLRKDGKLTNNVLKRVTYSMFPLKLCRWVTEFTMQYFNLFDTKYKNQLSHRGRYWPKFTESDVEDLIDVEFCGKMYPVPKNYDEILKKCYGDYMKLPPLEKQQPIHNIVECRI